MVVETEAAETKMFQRNKEIRIYHKIKVILMGEAMMVITK
jgi:hypothetical protein